MWKRSHILIALFSCTIWAQPLFRVLLLTDSIDRYFLLTVCEHFHGEGTNWGGSDFITKNGNHAKSWDSTDFPLASMWTRTSFDNRTINWSDLSCLLPSHHLHLLALHLFGSAESPPYHLGMCEKTKELNGPYCNTSDRIDRAFSVIHKQIGKVDVIFFNTMFWDVDRTNDDNRTEEDWQRYMFNVEARLCQIRRLEPKGKIFLKTTPLSHKSEARLLFMEYQQRVIRNISKSKNISLYDWANTTYSDDDFISDNFHLGKKLLMKQFVYIKSLALVSRGKGQKVVGSGGPLKTLRNVGKSTKIDHHQR